MTTYTASTFEVRLDDPLHRSRVLEETLPEPGGGQIVFEIERFGLTSNNLTYALLGNETPTRYWDVFPTESGWGRVPAWGSARVVGGDESVARRGERFVGLLPMTDRFVFEGRRTDTRLLVSTAPKRSTMPSTYSGMRAVTDEASASGPAANASILLQPFYSFAALLSQDVAGSGARTAVISSASSKAGLLVGRLLLRHGIRTVGLTAPSRREATESTGAFTEVRSYSQVSELAEINPAVFLDIAGNSEVSNAVAQNLSDNLQRIVIVGATHYEEATGGSGTTNSLTPEVDMFDTAEREDRYVAQHGTTALLTLEQETRDTLLPWASEWVHVDEVTGIAHMEEAWRSVQRPPTSPLHGTVVTASA